MGFIVVDAKGKKFYAGDMTIKNKKVPQWLSHPKLARVYTKRAWAVKAAEKWNGIVREVRNR